MNTGSPVITLAGSAPWFEVAAHVLTDHGFEVEYQAAPDGYLDHLIDRFVALVLVNGDAPLQAGAPAWQDWLVMARTEQGTRRIPVVVISRNPDVLAEALGTGADGALTPEQIGEPLLKLVQQKARLLAADMLRQLDCQCRQPLPPLAQLGLRRFNAGAYYAQHDAFEAQWMAEEGPVRELYRAILQVGVAYYHITRGNYHGGLKMLRRCVQWFARLPDECQGVNVKKLRDDAAHVRQMLQAMDPADIASFDRALLRPVEWIGEQPDC